MRTLHSISDSAYLSMTEIPFRLHGQLNRRLDMQCKALEKELAAHRSKPLARYHHIFQVEDK